jgi:hypothetical protein
LDYELNNVVEFSLLPRSVAPPIYLPPVKPPYSLMNNNVEIRLVNRPTVASKCSSGRKGSISLTSNQKVAVVSEQDI